VEYPARVLDEHSAAPEWSIVSKRRNCNQWLNAPARGSIHRKDFEICGVLTAIWLQLLGRERQNEQRQPASISPILAVFLSMIFHNSCQFHPKISAINAISTDNDKLTFRSATMVSDTHPTTRQLRTPMSQARLVSIVAELAHNREKRHVSN